MEPASPCRKISVIGLGYVGLPVAVAFAQKQKVVAYDINVKRLDQLKDCIDCNNEISAEALANSNLYFTAHEYDLQQADFHIITAPSPINHAKQPDLSCLIAASNTLGKYLKEGDIVVYESTVYPGATEEQCIPLLEKASGLKSGTDFFVGYSPERINPGDPVHTFTKICKVVAAQTDEALEIIAKEYGDVVTAGIYKAPSIKVAEAAKIIENIQRDINIALINELSIIFNKLNIDTAAVLSAAKTKWNFLPFVPGLVGGHCIGVDPYYLTHKAIISGIHPEVILAGRRVNDNMGQYIAGLIVKQMSRLGKSLKSARVAILGLTFKENCPDIRNTKVIDVINELRAFDIEVLVHDPLADSHDAEQEYGIELLSWDQLTDLDAIVLAVPHKEYLDGAIEKLIKQLHEPKFIFDVKSVLDKKYLESKGIVVNRL
jgi:UDP-N-acetyl-D-galactosamine dehydrogenase